jgi:nucleotide-binding universal stress UspA family protein
MQIARRTGAGLTLVHAGTMPPPTSERPDDPWAALWRERLAAERTRLGAIRERLSGQGVEVSQVRVDGEADVAIAHAAGELDADLVAVGTHGRTGIQEETIYLYERTFGSFTRTFSLPDGIDASHVRSELEDGVLTVVVPELPAAKPKKIEVQTGGAKH